MHSHIAFRCEYCLRLLSIGLHHGWWSADLDLWSAAQASRGLQCLCVARIDAQELARLGVRAVAFQAGGEQGMRRGAVHVTAHSGLPVVAPLYEPLYAPAL